MVPRSEDLSGLPPLLRRILAERGIAGDEALKKYFSPSLGDLPAAEDLPGVVRAADVILDAIQAGRKAVVFGDYDCDGVCATAILMTALNKIGAEAEPFIPHRLNEGYGMSEESVSRMLAETSDVGLVVTVDNGINSVEQVASLKARGITVVITDHHLPGEQLPAADAVVDPKIEEPACPEGLTGLCGAGVAFLLAKRLIDQARVRGLYAGPSISGPLIVLAGLATVTDIMPLVGVNRILVWTALAKFREYAPLGLRALLDRSAKTCTPMTVKDFAFLLGPRINAAGRMKTGMEALELVMSDDADIARELARMVDEYNTRRKEVERLMTEAAERKCVKGAPAQVIDLPDGHPGVAGIVAARIMELCGNVPTCVITGGHGSARAPDGVNIRDAMGACGDVLTNYGGHAAAGGFTVREGQVDEFRRRLCEYFKSWHEAAPAAERNRQKTIEIETKDLSLNFGEWLKRMEPFGEGNEEPVFALKGLMFSDLRQLGAEGRHLAANFRSRDCPRAVWWNHGNLIEQFRAASGQPHDLCFTVGISDYGERHIELRLTDMTRSEQKG